ncbi:hypothetical protein CBR_g48943 [Chara braunii]|uniref:Uncharacterized protein n=1 Tax=Chara braunii TaxID=69332 RepID=A0A388M415_CHABU|nr:hypothetical protein CBR_g48943 [Chara braunii]|eukprot:GBG89235.1 hypothetical protein CBR_g48943 [Chara braunii]
MWKHSEDKSLGSEDFPAKSSSAPRDLARSFGARGSAIIGLSAASPEGKMEVEGGPVVVHRPEDGHREPSTSKTSTNGLVFLPLAGIGMQVRVLSFMADLYRRLPLLLLVAVLLFAVVVFHICIVGRVPGRKQTLRTPKTARKMEKLQTKTTLSVGAGGLSRQRCSTAEGGRRPYDPTLYSYLPSHEIPLPPSDDDGDDPRSSTVPLGSGLTQDWMGSQLYRQASTPTYTDLLEGRTPVGYDAGLVDLSFGLRSGSGQDVTHTVLVNPACGTNHTPPSVGPSGLPDTRARCSGQSGDERGLLSRRDDDEGSTAEVVGRKVWDDYRRQSCQSSTSGIMRGVAKINVGADDTLGDCDGAGGEDCSAGDGRNDNDEDDDGEMEIPPVGKKRGGPRATNKFTEPRAGRRGKKSAGDTPRPQHRKDEDEDMEVGRRREEARADGGDEQKGRGLREKWDNLYLQFKIVHKFMGESGKPDFFTLTPRERKERGFDFRMDERVYSKMKAMSRGDHTIHPTNLVDTGAAGGVKLPGPHGGRNESGGNDGCGDGQDDDQGSTRDSTFSGGGVSGCGKRKNVRQQTFDTIADVMKENGNLMATTVDSASKRQCSILTRRARSAEGPLLPLQARQARARFCSPSSSRLLASAPSGASSTCSFVHVAVVDLHASTVHVLLRPCARRFPAADEMVPRNASGKGRKDSGAGDGGETQKGRGHVPKSKRQRVDEASSEHTEDFQPDEVLMVDAQGTTGEMRLGFGRDGVLREQLSALKQSLVHVGVAGALQRTPKAAGVVITEVRVPRQLPAVMDQGHARQPLPLQQAGASGGGKTQSAQKGDATASDTRTAAADHSSRSGLAEGATEERVDDVRRDEGRRDGKREGDDDDDRPLVTRLKGAAKEDGLEERSKLWVYCDAFWGQGPRKPLREAVGECADYFVAITNGDAGAEPPAMLIMSPNDVPRFKIEDPAQREPALRRARTVEKLVLRTIHGWIFKSSSRSVGFALWQGHEWSKVVSPALVYHMLAMKMDVPLWFAGVKIVDRLEDDDMAARQDASVLHVAECWKDALWCGQWADDGRMKHERWSRLADCLRALLSACMWIVRMGGDDDRSHYEAWLYSSMVAKPTTIAAGSYIFNWRRHIVDNANLVLDRIGKDHLTLGDYPHCILEWCDCGLVFGQNAALKNAAEAVKHGWIGSGPAAEEDGDEGS